MSDSNSISKMGRFRNHQKGEVFDEAIETFFKFWKDGRPALLNFNTHDGRAWINFSGFLGIYNEQKEKSSIYRTKSPRSKASPSPSKIKRNKERAEAFREKKRKEATGPNNFSEESNSSCLKLSKTVSTSNTLADASRTSEVSFANSSSFQNSINSENDDADVTKSDDTQSYLEELFDKQVIEVEEANDVPSTVNQNVEVGNNPQIEDKDSSSEETPKVLENKATSVHTAYTEADFAFWERKVEAQIVIWNKEGIESEDFLSLQIQFLRKVREEMWDSKLFDDWIDWHNKMYPEKPFFEEALCEFLQ